MLKQGIQNQDVKTGKMLVLRVIIENKSLLVLKVPLDLNFCLLLPTNRATYLHLFFF